MKFTEALRLADEMELPDSVGQFMVYKIEEWDGEKPPCCAIGGADIASRNVTYKIRDNIRAYNIELFTSSFLEMSERYDDEGLPDSLSCPFHLTKIPFPLIELIAHLYDTHLWTRTKIAEFLEGKRESRESND